MQVDNQKCVANRFVACGIAAIKVKPVPGACAERDLWGYLRETLPGDRSILGHIRGLMRMGHSGVKVTLEQVHGLALEFVERCNYYYTPALQQAPISRAQTLITAPEPAAPNAIGAENTYPGELTLDSEDVLKGLYEDSTPADAESVLEASSLTEETA